MAVIQLAGVSKCFRMRLDRPRSFQELAVSLFRSPADRPQAELFWALRGVSLEVEAGETLGIIGSNGSGKSTCLKLLTRIIEPTSGTIRVAGRVSALLELGAGFHPELTGRENVYLNGSVLGLRRREMERRLDDIVSFAELERFIDMPVKFYSSGMYVRLAFAIAINVQPDILLVDEVLAVGDQLFQEKCLERINDLRMLGVTIVFVSHNLDVVRNLCSRAIWLDDGALCDDGLADTVVASYLEHAHAREEMQAFATRATARTLHPTGAATVTSPSGSPALEEAPAGIAPAGEAEPMRPTLQQDTDPALSRRRRWGSHEAEITDVRFLDADGQERMLLTTGELATVVIHYLAHRRIEDPVFGLAFYRSDGLHLGGSNTALARFEVPFIEGKGQVHYTIRMVPFLEGAYYVTAAIHNATETHTYDYREMAYRIKVHLGAVAERYGILYLPAEWRHLPGPKQPTDGAQVEHHGRGVVTPPEDDVPTERQVGEGL